MTAHPETIGPDDTTNHAVVLMLHGGFRHLPVVQGDDLLGVISIRDLVPLVLEDTAAARRLTGGPKSALPTRDTGMSR
jgi:CBS domain-containing protein